MKTKNQTTNWKEFELGEILNYEQPTKYIVESTDYDDSYKTPVLTAGKSFLLGHTKETTGIYENPPVIIFDDFTTASKYVDFKFKVKSSAMKMLTPINENINLKYIYFMIQSLKFNYDTHKRYYLSVYQHLKIPMPVLPDGTPDLKEQERIVKILEKAQGLKDKGKNVEELFDEYLKSIFYEMFYGRGFEEVEFGNKEFFETQSGGTPLRAKKEYWDNGKIAWIGSTACKDLPIYNAYQFITEEGLKNSSAKTFPEDTVLIALVGATIGKTGLLKFNCATNQNIAGIIIKDNKKVTPDYLFYSIRQLYPKFISLSNDAFKMANLSFIRSLKIPLPSSSLQQKFTKIVDQVEKMKENLKKTNNYSNELFNSLTNKAFGGKL